jgi:spore germination cell wall hydrolase CwlJ-like protein
LAALERERAAEAARRAEEERRRLTEIPPYGDDQLMCLALTIYWEGRSESRVGQVAIAHVVLNRVKDSRFPRTICGVVKQGGHLPRGACQFSWWCDGKSDTPTDAAQWAMAQKIAREEARPGAGDPTGGSLYFHNGLVKPAWARSMTRTVAIGDHVFYR